MDSSGSVSGGVVESDIEVIQSQAASKVDVDVPPVDFEDSDSGEGVEVLVVEQSESMRTLLTAIFKNSQIRAAFVGDVDEAKRMITSLEPRLIISEFRMPSMAAKVLVESLRSEGKRIPVLVTTSQSGKTADLLVEKLGVSGYLSKPLTKEAVTTCLNAFLGEGVVR